MSESVGWIFDSALSHTRRSDAVEIRVDTLAQIRLSTSVSVQPPLRVKILEAASTIVILKSLKWKIRQIFELKNKSINMEKSNFCFGFSFL